MNVDGSGVIVADITGLAGTATYTGGRLRPTHEEIARLAYQRYESNGCEDGNDLQDWLFAEQELVHHYA